MNNVVSIQDKPQTPAEIRTQVNTIQQVMQAVMIKDTHYGVIPGTKTPSLYKPGAEKIMATFRLSADPEISDLSDMDQIRYQVKVRLVSPSGVFVGAGIGECSSNEEKFKWRKAVCSEEFDETAPDRKREKWQRGYQNAPAFKLQQIRTEPADLANTVLKMAKKRALVDAVLTATAASDIFTQDIEDLPPEYIDSDDAPPSVAQRPQARQQPATQGQKGGSGFATENQVRLLNAKLRSAGKSVEDYCKVMGVKTVEETPFSQVNDAIAWITE